MQSNRDLVANLKLAQVHLDKAIELFTKEANIEAIYESQKVQDLLGKAMGLLTKEHIQGYVVDLIKNGKAELAAKEILRLREYNFK